MMSGICATTDGGHFLIRGTVTASRRFLLSDATDWLGHTVSSELTLLLFMFYRSIDSLRLQVDSLFILQRV